MNGWQEFVSNIVSSAAWPLVVLILGITFRKTLRSAIGRATRFEGLGATIEFAETLRRIDTEADAVAIEAQKKSGEVAGVSQTQPTQPPEKNRRHRMFTPDGRWGSSTSPTEIVMRAWTQLEQEILLLTLYATKYVPSFAKMKRSSRRGILSPVLDLVRAEILTQRDYGLIEDLQATRDRVAHNNLLPTRGQALAYAEAAQKAQTYLVQKEKELVPSGSADTESTG